MTRRHAVRARALVAVLLLLPLDRGGAAPQSPTAPDAKALAKAEVTLLDAAVADLTKEYAAHVKDPRGSRLRPQSSYFVDHPVQLSAGALLDALERPPGDDPRLAAYVRWQLLSAAPEKFDPAVVRRVVAIYQKAPAPAPRFGMSPEEKGRLDVLLLKAKKEEDVALSARLDERVRQGAEQNRPILAYRDALYAKLPEGFEALAAGLRDAHERTLAAAGGGAYDEHAGRVVKDALAWAQSGAADPEQCARLADLVAKLRFVRSPPYYVRAAWRQPRPSWSTRSDGVYSPKKLADLEAVLREAQNLAQEQRDAGRAAQPAAQRRGGCNGAKATRD